MDDSRYVAHLQPDSSVTGCLCRFAHEPVSIYRDGALETLEAESVVQDDAQKGAVRRGNDDG
jgi:hypothetical protein